MKKSDLKNEMVIQTRNGDISVLYDGILHAEDGFEILEEYQEDLVFPNWYDVDVSELDIMKVGTSPHISLFRKISQKDDITWIWERQEVDKKLIADKATLLAIKDYMRVGDWDPREVQEMILGDVDMLKHEIMGDTMLSTDECCIIWGEDDYVCMLDEFLDKYFESFMKRVCGVIMSFEDNDIGYIGYNHKEFEEYVK